jgi:hypothetical protein
MPHICHAFQVTLYSNIYQEGAVCCKGRYACMDVIYAV